MKSFIVLTLTVICVRIPGDQLIWETKRLKPDLACPEAVCLFFSSSSLSFASLSACEGEGDGPRAYSCGARGLMLFVTVLLRSWRQLKEVTRFMVAALASSFMVSDQEK